MHNLWPTFKDIAYKDRDEEESTSTQLYQEVTPLDSGWGGTPPSLSWCAIWGSS